MSITSEAPVKSQKLRTHFINDQRLPLVVEPAAPMKDIEDFNHYLRQNNAFLKENLLKYGGLLFRNFPVRSENDFSEVIQHLNTGNFINYIGGDSPRTIIKDGIYTSTEAPPWLKIPLHNELSFVKYYPKHIYFYCHIAPQDRGQTIIADSRTIFKNVDPKIRKILTDKKIKYISCYYHKSKFMDFVNWLQPSHKSWLQVFETSDKREVERLCRENEFGLEWNQNDWIRISQIRPAVIKHPDTQEDVWFNQAHLFDFSPKMLGFWKYLGAKLLYCRKHMRLHEVFFADGSRIPRKYLSHIMDVLDANTIAFPWQQGDVLVLDNVLAMHGRAPFTGKRRVMTAMTG